jgi:hypothetical protein
LHLTVRKLVLSSSLGVPSNAGIMENEKKIHHQFPRSSIQKIFILFLVIYILQPLVNNTAVDIDNNWGIVSFHFAPHIYLLQLIITVPKYASFFLFPVLYSYFLSFFVWMWMEKLQQSSRAIHVSTCIKREKKNYFISANELEMNLSWGNFSSLSSYFLTFANTG